MKQKQLNYKKVPQYLPVDVVRVIMDYYTPCPPGKILNLNSRRCVKRDSLKGKRLIKEQEGCPPGKMINPNTNRCIDIEGKIGRRLRSQQQCPAGKIMNPNTNRCVDIEGKIGRRLRGITEDLPPCPEGKVRHPFTKRCVKLDSPTLNYVKIIRPKRITRARSPRS